MDRLYAVIMAGGSGTRFWPLSRRNSPKQLLRFDRRQSMLQQTVSRLAPLVPPERTIVVTTGEQASQIAEQLPRLPADNILIETVGRNTSAAIALAACYIKRLDPKGIMAVLPADHVIKKETTFRRLLRKSGALAAERDLLITLGITPNHPHTGYGYILYKRDAPVATATERGLHCYQVSSFEEKPVLEKAQRLLAEGNALWNSGMFVWSVKTILRALERFLPDIYRQMSPLLDNWDKEKITHIYPRLPAISIDYGVMEKADNVAVFPADLGWNDLGSWCSLGEIFACDANSNISPGKLRTIDSSNLTVFAPHKMVAVIGVDNVVVVDTEDVILVCSSHKTQEVKKMVELLREEGCHEYL